MTERDFAISVVKRLQDAGHQALFAGGCVRDELLGQVPNDYDVATAALPDQVRQLFRHNVPVGAQFGVIRVLGPRTGDQFWEVEVATFRSDGAYTDGRRPDDVCFSNAREDALRRDFTINGMFFDPIKKELLDYVGGREDLQAKVLRAIGDPVQRFTEDKLRLMRAVRMATRFGLTIEPRTAAALQGMSGQVKVVSAERIGDELAALLLQPRRAWGVNRMYETGLIAAILPELLPMKGLPQGPPAAPTGDLWDHVLRVLEALDPAPSFPLVLAALLHDVGKPVTMGRTPDRYTFHDHENVGREMTAKIAERLKLSNATRDRAAWLVEKHLYLCGVREMRLSRRKTILAHPGIEELLALHRADALASGRSTDHVEFCEALLRDWKGLPPPVVNGEDLKQLGLEPGPQFSRLLNAVREAQLEETVTTREQGLELVKRVVDEGRSRS